MKAADRTLPDWFGLIRRGSLMQCFQQVQSQLDFMLNV